jgi:hypothetical protein
MHLQMALSVRALNEARTVEDEAQATRWPGSADGDHTARRREAVASDLHELAKEEGMTEQRRTTTEEGKRVGDAIGVDWSRPDCRG